MEALVILIHQFIFQGMFAAKNISLRKTTDQPIQGKNKEVRVAIVYFAFFNVTAFILACFNPAVGQYRIMSSGLSWTMGLVLMAFNLVIAASALVDMKESWRVGVLEDQKTELVLSGVYRFSRNPYFLSYLIMFLAYSIFLQNIILLGLSILGFLVIHNMILKEEAYLLSVHGDAYKEYQNKVPRYLFR